jgi:DNA modification methylase
MSRHALPRNQITVGDVRTRLAELPSGSVNTVITSPPYFMLRDYGHTDQLGAEATVDDWARSIADVCTELARVLRPDGALWLNLGDGYSRHAREGAEKKSLLLGPERVALALTNAGWLLRNAVVWAKPNPMPSSVRDRLTNTHEFVYFFTRSPRYFFDLDAIRRPSSPRESPASGHQRPAGAHYLPRAAVPALGQSSNPRINLNHGLAGMRAGGRVTHPLGANPGDVWMLSTGRYKGAHFATFPPELVRRPLLATCPERVCVRCGTAWLRVEEVVDGRRLRAGPLRPACGCRADWQPGVVLDPFMGSGTVALTAEQHHRDWVGIELNPAYARMAEQRLRHQRAHEITNHNKAA